MTPGDAPRTVGPPDRVALLDALRGFALLGILFVNLTWFTGYAVLTADQRAGLVTAGPDAVVAWLIHFLVDGKFWSLFALLFGAGAAVQGLRAEARGDDFGRLMTRRLSVLLLIGLLHAVLVWFGDIVSLYAVVGFALLLLRRRSDRAVLCWAAVCLAAPIVQSGIWLAVDRILSVSADSAGNGGHGPAELVVFFGSGTYFEVLAANWAFLKERWFLAVYEGRCFKLLGMFLLGYWAGRRGIFHEPGRHRRLLRQVFTWGLLIGIPANVVFAQWAETAMQWPPSMSAASVGAVQTLGAAALCLAYVAAGTLLWGCGVPGWGMTLFSHPGRMSLTNYLSQSVCGVTVFYGVGFGYWGRLGPTGSVVLIGAIFGAQALFSAWWLRRFRYGPVEWGWRCVTYWRRLPIRRVSLRQGVLLRAPPSRRGDSGSAATTEPVCR